MGDSFLEAGLYFGSPRIFQVGFSINPNPFSPPDSRASLAFSHKNTGNRRQNRINQFQDLFCDVLIGLIFYHNVIVKSNVPEKRGFVHYLQHSQNKILVRILPNSTLILDLFMLPEVRNFSNLKPVIS